MKIGKWELKPLVAGMFRLDGGAMFGVVPKTLWVKSIPADDMNRIPMAMRMLLIHGDKKTIVVDAGAGTGYGEKLSGIYAFESIRPMSELMGSVGLSPDAVTDVIVTHLHFDHGGGLAYPDGNHWRVTFPRARHHVQRAQWEHALSPTARDRASYFPERIEILDRENVLELHDGDWSLAEGLEILRVDGHTPGQQLPKVSDGEKTLFYCGDLIPTSAHIPIPYIMSYDLEPVVAMEEKARILERAVPEQWILFFEHDAAVEACHAVEHKGRYAASTPLSL